MKVNKMDWYNIQIELKLIDLLLFKIYQNQKKKFSIKIFLFQLENQRLKVRLLLLDLEDILEED